MRHKLLKYISSLLFISLMIGVFPLNNIVKADGDTYTLTVLSDQTGCQVEYQSVKYDSGVTFSVAEGELVRLYAKVAEGYEFIGVDAEGGSGSRNGSIGYLLTMPSNDVTVTFHFRQYDPYKSELNPLILDQAVEGYDSSDYFEVITSNKLGTGNMIGDYTTIEITDGDVSAFVVNQIGGGNRTSTGIYNEAYIGPAEGLTAGTYIATATMYYDEDGAGTDYDKVEISSASVRFTVVGAETHTLTIITNTEGFCGYRYNNAIYYSENSFTVNEGSTVLFYANYSSSDYELIGVSSDEVTVDKNGSIGFKFIMPSSDVTVTLNFRSLSEPEPVLTGWQLIDDTWYYFDEEGNNVNGWLQLNGKWYFFDDSVMQTGWLRSPGNGKWYFLHPINGYMMVDTWASDGGMWYYLGSDGYMVTGWRQIGGSWYYFNPTGGAMLKGWQKINDVWYYFNPAGGAMVTGWKQIEGKWYFFQSNGAMKTGWLSSGGNWYYLMGSGEMATGEVTIGSKTYNFSSSGVWIPG